MFFRFTLHALKLKSFTRLDKTKKALAIAKAFCIYLRAYSDALDIRMSENNDNVSEAELLPRSLRPAQKRSLNEVKKIKSHTVI
jgi:hypothetical protein